MTFIYNDATFARDAQQQYAFITPQLYRIEAEVYEVEYPSFDISQYMYINEDGDMWDVGTVFYSMDGAGQMEFISGKGFDIPYADTVMSQFTQGFHLSALGYEWSLQELQRAAKLGRNLGNDKASKARQGAEMFKYNIGLTGKNSAAAATSEKNLTGLFNWPTVPNAVVANGATGASPLWSTKTPDEILADINSCLESVFNNTKETRIANTLILPTSAWQYFARTRITQINMTLLEFIKQANSYTADTGQPLVIKRSRFLENAGTGNTRMMVAYDNDKAVVQFHLPGDHEFLPAFQKSSMTWEVAGIMNIGGTEVRLPKAMSYRYGF